MVYKQLSLISVQITVVIMKHSKLLFISLLSIHFVIAQCVSVRLQSAFNKMQSQPSFKHASISLYVLNSKTNEVVFDYNSQVGLTPASCQKIITSVTAFETLGNNFQYKTELSYAGTMKNGVLDGNLIITGYGDPTLASWRYTSVRDTTVLNGWIEAIKKIGINKINGNIILNANSFTAQPVPGGWPWEDIGNYYGAGCWGLNWHENQYDLTLLPGKKEGEEGSISSIKPTLTACTVINNIKTVKSDSDKDAYIYMPPYSSVGFVYGTIPVGSKGYTISGAMPNPFNQIAEALDGSLKGANINYKKIINSIEYLLAKDTIPKSDSIFYTYFSPPLDSINYWFLKKSVNLYGEALLKTMAYTKTGEGTTEKGVRFIKQFWQDKGIEKSALRMMDGSGLSPSNRLTTNALVTALQYARDKAWFPSFYNALPIYNGMKLKSGTMGGVKSFAGYHTSEDGINYTVAMIVNDFDGSSAEVTLKIFEVLNELK